MRSNFLALMSLTAGLASLQAAPTPKLDRHGDPLPAGAVARIGTVRLRHGGVVRSVAFSAEGKRLVSTDGDSVAVWDVATGRSLAFRFLPSQPGCWPVLSPDGTLIACRLDNGDLGALKTESGKVHSRLPSDEGRILNLAFSRDNRWLAGNDDDGTTFLWDVAAGKLSWKCKAPAKIDALDCRYAFTPDGKMVAFALREGTVVLRDTQTGKEEVRIAPRDGKAYQLDGLAISPDGRVLVTSNCCSRFEMWRIKSGAFLLDFEAFGCWFGPVFSPDGKELLCGTLQGGLRLWDVASGKVAREWQADQKGPVDSFAFSPDGKLLAVGGNDHAVHLWDLAREKELNPPGDLGGDLAVRLLADGKTLLSHCTYRWEAVMVKPFEPRLGLWDLEGRSLRSATFDPDRAHAFAVTPDGGMVALAEGPHFSIGFRPVQNKYLRSSIRLVDLARGKELLKMEKVPCQITDLAFSPDGQYLFLEAYNAGPEDESYDTSTVVQVWKRSATTLDKVADLPSRDHSFVCAPDSRWIGVPSGGSWNVYHCGTDKLFRSWATLADVRAASPSGRVLVCTSHKDETAFLVELASGKTIRRLECKPRHFHAPRFAIAPDGRIIAGSLSAEAIMLWDAFTGKQLARLEGHRGDVRSLHFSPDGRRLVSGSSDSTILVWDYRALLPKAPGGVVRHAPERLEQLWGDLQSEDAGRGYRAVADLVQAPEQAVALLRRKLALPSADDRRRIQGWIDDLGNDRFPVRSRATAELARLSELAEPLLRAALKQSLPLEHRRRIEALLDGLVSVPPGPWLATLRALDALELMATPDARRLLEELSKGDAESPQTREARQSLDRLTRRRAAE